MAKFRFTGNFDWDVQKAPKITHAYKAGTVETVTQKCGDAAKKLGRGDWVKENADKRGKS